MRISEFQLISAPNQPQTNRISRNRADLSYKLETPELTSIEEPEIKSVLQKDSN